MPFCLRLPLSVLLASFCIFSSFQTSMAWKMEVQNNRPFRPNSNSLPLALSSSSLASSERICVALTREAGNNEKLRVAIQSHSTLRETIGEIQFVELPCIEHADGPDSKDLPVTIASTPYDYICITSPEAATVFAHACEVVRNTFEPTAIVPLGRIAVVGKATEQVLKKHGLEVAFVPSKATAKVLADELPHLQSADNRRTTVLYPASLQAKMNLEEGLDQRSEFVVTRLNTYDTRPAEWTEDQINLARQCTIACFGSPSAVNGWTKNIDCIEGMQGSRIPAACIGETSADQCRQMKWDESKIFYPEKPGLDGWADAVVHALETSTILVRQ